MAFDSKTPPVAIIPARKGSKRIPGKNIKDFCGKPMIAHSIDCAIKSGLFSKIIVSTDCDEIARISKNHGAEVPFMRPGQLADDFTPIANVYLHVLELLSEKQKLPKYFCGITATAPLMQERYLREGFEMMEEKQAPAAFSVCQFPAPIQRALKVSNDGSLKMFWPENELVRSNDLELAFFDSGQFYWLKTDTFMEEKKVWLPGSLPVTLPRHLTQDIDNEDDWKQAEIFYKFMQYKN